jgi:muramoyltetrapeptide carboxypeptidase
MLAGRIPPKLNKGDTIGIISPSHVADENRYAGLIAAIEGCGFRVKTGENLYKRTYGYAASEQERADDLNAMAVDDEVGLVFFGGGYGGLEIIPLIDYEAIRRKPKLFLSYSDGTSILNAIYARTGVMTYYGQTPGTFEFIRPYNLSQFMSHLVEGNPGELVKNSKWIPLCDGVCEGTLIGGYLLNVALLANTGFCGAEADGKVVLFVEDYEKFSNMASVSMLLSYLEQSSLTGRMSGLLFGHYSENENPQLLERLRRFGEKHKIPVAYCDDFGHGANQAVLPIGCRAVLDTRENRLEFRYS